MLASYYLFQLDDIIGFALLEILDWHDRFFLHKPHFNTVALNLIFNVWLLKFNLSLAVRMSWGYIYILESVGNERSLSSVYIR